MKKIYFLLCLALPLLAQSQNTLKFGFNAGAVLTDVNGEDYASGFKYGFGYMAGISIEVTLTERLSFTTALNYERKSPVKKAYYGYYVNYLGPQGMAINKFEEGRATLTTILDCLTIPVNLKYYIGSTKGFYITAGAFATIMLAERVKVEDNGPFESYHNNYNAMDYGVTLGIGKKLKLSDTQNLNIEIRDNLGLFSIADDFKASTNTINVFVNWQFTL